MSRDKEPRPQCILYDFSKAEPTSQLAAAPTLGKWRLIDWESPRAAGKLLWAYREGAAPLSLTLGVQGWYAISLGLWCPPQGQSRIRVRLSGEDAWDELYVREPCRWLPEGGCRFEEHFWRLADLSGRNLEIAATAFCSGLGFVRLIPLNEEQARRAQSPERIPWLWTNDGRGTFIEDKDPPSRAVTDNLDAFAGTDFTDMSWSIFAADVVNYNSAFARRFDFSSQPTWRETDVAMSRNIGRLLAAGEDANALAIAYGAQKKIHVWLGQRMQLFTLEAPKDIVLSDFFATRRDLACRTRDGRPMAQMSFAFPEVRRHLIDILVELARYCPFGLHLQFNRGVPCSHFEKPVLEAFAQRWGGDMRAYGVLDERVVMLRGQYITIFLRELRERLCQLGLGHSAIGVNCMQTKALNEEFGMDIVTWAREGLVTHLMPYRWEWRGEKADDVWRWYDPYEMDYFHRAVQGTSCKILPYAYNGNNHRWALPHEHRSRAWRLIRQGVDGLCAWDAAGWLARLGLGRPGELEVWQEVSRPLAQEDIRSLGGIAIDEYSPHYGC